MDRLHRYSDGTRVEGYRRPSGKRTDWQRVKLMRLVGEEAGGGGGWWMPLSTNRAVWEVPYPTLFHLNSEWYYNRAMWFQAFLVFFFFVFLKYFILRSLCIHMQSSEIIKRDLHVPFSFFQWLTSCKTSTVSQPEHFHWYSQTAGHH